MSLNVYIRNHVDNYARNVLKKEYCQICGSEEDLRIKYMYSFNDVLNKCLCDLNYPYHENEKDYSDIEQQNIINWTLGFYTRNKSITLCKSCQSKGRNICDKNMINLNEKVVILNNNNIGHRILKILQEKLVKKNSSISLKKIIKQLDDVELNSIRNAIKYNVKLVDFMETNHIKFYKSDKRFRKTS